MVIQTKQQDGIMPTQKTKQIQIEFHSESNIMVFSFLRDMLTAKYVNNIRLLDITLIGDLSLMNFLEKLDNGQPLNSTWAPFLEEPDYSPDQQTRDKVVNKLKEVSVENPPQTPGFIRLLQADHVSLNRELTAEDTLCMPLNFQSNVLESFDKNNAGKYPYVVGNRLDLVMLYYAIFDPFTDLIDLNAIKLAYPGEEGLIDDAFNEYQQQSSSLFGYLDPKKEGAVPENSQAPAPADFTSKAAELARKAEDFKEKAKSAQDLSIAGDLVKVSKLNAKAALASRMAASYQERLDQIDKKRAEKEKEKVKLQSVANDKPLDERETLQLSIKVKQLEADAMKFELDAFDILKKIIKWNAYASQKESKASEFALDIQKRLEGSTSGTATVQDPVHAASQAPSVQPNPDTTNSKAKLAKEKVNAAAVAENNLKDAKVRVENASKAVEEAKDAFTAAEETKNGAAGELSAGAPIKDPGSAPVDLEALANEAKDVFDKAGIEFKTAKDALDQANKEFLDAQYEAGKASAEAFIEAFQKTPAKVLADAMNRNVQDLNTLQKTHSVSAWYYGTKVYSVTALVQHSPAATWFNLFVFLYLKKAKTDLREWNPLFYNETNKTDLLFGVRITFFKIKAKILALCGVKIFTYHSRLKTPDDDSTEMKIRDCIKEVSESPFAVLLLAFFSPHPFYSLVYNKKIDSRKQKKTRAKEYFGFMTQVVDEEEKLPREKGNKEKEWLGLYESILSVVQNPYFINELVITWEITSFIDEELIIKRLEKFRSILVFELTKVYIEKQKPIPVTLKKTIDKMKSTAFIDLCLKWLRSAGADSGPSTKVRHGGIIESVDPLYRKVALFRGTPTIIKTRDDNTPEKKRSIP